MGALMGELMGALQIDGSLQLMRAFIVILVFVVHLVRGSR